MISKANLKVIFAKKNLLPIKQGTGAIGLPSFDFIWTVKYVYFIHLMIQCHLQDHNINVKIKLFKI